jgi:hypothetical protein
MRLPNHTIRIWQSRSIQELRYKTILYPIDERLECLAWIATYPTKSMANHRSRKDAKEIRRGRIEI